MAQPKLDTEFDPESTPFTSPAARFTYLEHPDVYPGKLKVNTDTLEIVRIKGQAYPQFPLKLPQNLMNVTQRYVRTCGTPDKNGNAGCEAAVNGGCAILRQYGRIGPVNVIVEKDGKVDSAKCHHVYCGISDQGRPTSQAHMLLDGWNILMDRTTIPENIRDAQTRRETVRYTEVPDLAPWYEQKKVGRFAEKPPEPKRRGRKPGSKNKPKVQDAYRENVPTATD